jgi:predicted nucleotidyltransferase
MHSDFVELLQLLNEHKVKYLIIGGYAVGFYAEPRYTKDIDIWVEASRTNGARLIKALQLFGAPTENIQPEDIATPGLLYIFGVPPLRVDLLNRLKGVKFKDAYEKRNLIAMPDTEVSVVDVRTLKKLKRLAGRPQDRLDLKSLAQVEPSFSKSKKRARARPRKKNPRR